MYKNESINNECTRDARKFYLAILLELHFYPQIESVFLSVGRNKLMHKNKNQLIMSAQVMRENLILQFYLNFTFTAPNRKCFFCRLGKKN